MSSEAQKREELIRRAQQAAQSGIMPILEESEEQVIARMLSGFRSGQYTHDFLVGNVAVLSELRAIHARCARRILEGVQAGEKMTGENHAQGTD